MMFSILVAASALYAFLPSEALRRNTNRLALALMFSSYSLAVFLTSFALGHSRLSQRIGAKNMMTLGMAGVAFSALIASLAAGLNGWRFVLVMIMSRVLQGACASLAQNGAMLIVLVCNPDTAATAVAWVEFWESLSSVFGPLLGGLLFNFKGFSAVFWFTSLLTLLMAAVLRFLTPSLNEPSSTDADACDIESKSPSSISSTENSSMYSGSSSGKVTIASICSSFRHLVLLLVCVMGLSLYSFLDASLELRLGSEFQISSVSVGSILSLFALCYAVPGPIIAWIYSKWGRPVLCVGGAIAIAFGTLFLSEYVITSLFSTIVAIGLVGFGAACLVVPVVPHLVHSVAPDSDSAKEVVVGLAIASYSLGDILGPLAGALMTWIPFQVILMSASGLIILLLVLQLVEAFVYVHCRQSMGYASFATEEDPEE